MDPPTSPVYLLPDPAIAPDTGPRDSEIVDRAAPRARGRAAPLGSAPMPSNWRADRRPVGDIAGEISTRVVGLLREHTGRGPTKAKATISGDLVLLTLGDCLTTAERRLTAVGQGELVARARAVLHDGIRSEATAIVEELCDRTVSGYLTAHLPDPDVAIIAFYFAPSAAGPTEP